MTTVAEGDFMRNRPRLFGLAYRMLGTRTDAEDVLQDAWLRVDRAAAEPIASPEAFLTTVVTRLSLDRLRSARATRESYYGPWMPEPLHTTPDPAGSPEEMAVRTEDIGLAALEALEHLGPEERAVLVLHEAFDYSHREIARVLDCSEAASRQHLRRARTRLQAVPRFTATREQRLRLTEAFVRACRLGDMAALEQIFREDVRSTADGGGKVPAGLKPVIGREAVVRFITAASTKGFFDQIEVAEVNGEPACAIWLDGRLIGVVIFETDGNQVTEVRNIGNPDKLARWSETVRLVTPA